MGEGLRIVRVGKKEILYPLDWPIERKMETIVSRCTTRMESPSPKQIAPRLSATPSPDLLIFRFVWPRRIFPYRTIRIRKVSLRVYPPRIQGSGECGVHLPVMRRDAHHARSSFTTGVHAHRSQRGRRNRRPVLKCCQRAAISSQVDRRRC